MLAKVSPVGMPGSSYITIIWHSFPLTTLIELNVYNKLPQ